MSTLSRALTALAVATLVSGLLPAAAAAAPAGTLDPPAAGAVGATSPADTGWLGAVRPCTHWVQAGAPAGGNGTTTPWATLAQAMAGLRPGQTGCVRAGTYLASNLRPAAWGTAAQPIALRAETPGTVTVRPQAAETAVGVSASTFLFENTAGVAGWWLVEGFTLERERRDGAGVWMLGFGGQLRSMAVRNTVIRDGKGYAGVIVRGRVTDVLVEGNEITGFARWRNDAGALSHTPQPGYRRQDSHGIVIEVPEQADRAAPSVERVLVRRNSLHDNGGDGVQCLGVADGVGAFTADPADIDLVDNRVVNTPGSAPVEENAIDIKSCQRVSIRGSDPPTTAGGNVQWNKFAEFLPTVSGQDQGGPGGNGSNGDAVVIHYFARRVLVENLRIWNVCTGISMGRGDASVADVTVRRVLLFGVRAGATPPGGDPAADGGRCQGRGIQATRATGLNLYHLTLDDVPDRAVLLGAGVADVDLWNSVVRLRSGGPTPRWVDANPLVDSIDSDYNLFWHRDTGGSGAYFGAGGTPLTLTGWRGTGRDRDRADPLGSHAADPLFVPNPATADYVTQPGSLARDGALVTGPGAPVCGARPDLGFLESCG